MTLRKLCPLMREERRTEVGRQMRGYVFPPLADCRKAFERFCRTPIDSGARVGIGARAQEGQVKRPVNLDDVDRPERVIRK